MIVTLFLFPVFGCNSASEGGQSPVPRGAAAQSSITPEPWISKPQAQWPQLVLANEASFQSSTPLHGASAFLVQSEDGEVFAATAKHLIGDAGGVEPAIPIGRLNQELRSWVMFPRTKPNLAVRVDQAIGQDCISADADWLLLKLRIGPKELPAHALKVRSEPIQVGEKIFLLGCPYSEEGCKQNVYSGIVTKREFSHRFRYEISPAVDLRGFSGAPIIDQNGYLVGVMTVWFDPKRSGDKYLEGGGEDATVIYPMLRRA